MAQHGGDTRMTEQEILNESYDWLLSLLGTSLWGYDDTVGAAGARRVAVSPEGRLESISPDQAIKVTTSGTATYIGFAEPGTDEASAVWQSIKYDNGRLTYADGNSKFDNIATDLTSLNYL